MEYFLRYLPLDSMPKLEDLPCNVYDTYSGKARYCTIEEFGSNAFDYYQMTALFICSRESKKGDKVYGVKHGNLYASFFINEGNITDNCISIIGRLSKNVIWAKEFDIISSEEILLNYRIPIKIKSNHKSDVEYFKVGNESDDDDIYDLISNRLNLHGGNSASWDIKDIEVDYVSIKCKCCGTFI